MAYGDQIYVMRPLVGLEGVYEHHGIDCGDGTVIHYSKVGEATVRRTSLAAFANGHRVYLKQYDYSFIAEDVVQRAESRLGEQRYSLVANNCEHFATWCKTGVQASSQLSSFGLDVSQLRTSGSQQLLEEAARTGDPQQSMALLRQAVGNVAIARHGLQQQLDQIQAEMQTWHRVAQLALKQGKEPVARAALERKVAQKRRLADLQDQLDQLSLMQGNLDRNGQLLQQRIGSAVRP